ncbi:MAG: hypothetical protein HYV97_08660 [Bdellovibrio sp.]|nr:hypothetical protein [Bdellovibrio sp.]
MGKIMPLMTTLIRKGFALFTTVGLLVTAGPVELRAQATPPARPAPDNSQWAATAMGAITGFGNSFMQSMQAAQAAQRAAAMMQLLQPKIIPARFFPQCRIAQADPNFPANACSNVSDAASLQMAEALVNLATNYNQFYEQLTSTAQNTPFPVGVQCLEESRKQVESQINDKINSLTATIARIKKETQLFRDQNRAITEDMRNISDELNGTQNNRTLGNTNRPTDLRDQFKDAACNEVLTDTMVAGGKGLRGLRDVFNTPGEGGQGLRSSAANFQRDIPVLKQHLETQMTRMIADVREVGLEDWVGQADSRLNNIRRGGLTSFQGMSEAMTNEITRFNTDLTKIKGELQSVVGNEFQIPKMDSHFQENIQGFANGAKSFFKKKFVSGCVSGANSTGVALTTDQIISGLRMSNNETGTTLNDFKVALTNILNTDSFIQDKMAQIRALEQQYGGSIKVEFVDAGAKKQLASPYQLYQTQVANCEKLYSQDQTFSTQGGGMGLAGLSQKEKIERAQRYLEDAKKLEQGFVDRLVGTIKDKVLNCGDNANTRTGQCGSATMDPGANSNFCINTASRCADNIQKCYAKVEQKVKEKEALLKIKANNYNKNIRGLIAAQEGMLSRIKAQVVQDQEFLKRFFPGANYKFPEDVFVGMPTMEDSEFGVQLIGGKDLDLKYLSEDLPAQLGKMKASLEEQKTGVNTAINAYKEEQKAALQKNKSDWATLKSTCETAAKGLRAKVAAANEEGAKKQAETDSKVGEFCQKYDNLRNSNPMAGCSGDFSPSKLQGEATRIVANLDASVSANLNEYSNLCAQYNNEKTVGASAGSGSSSAYPLREMCESGGTWDVAYGRLAARILTNTPPADASKKEAIRSYLTGDGAKPEISNAAFSTALDDLKGLKGLQADSLAPIPTTTTASAPGPNGTNTDPNIRDSREAVTAIQTAMGTTGMPFGATFTGTGHTAATTEVNTCFGATSGATPTYPFRTNTTDILGANGLQDPMPTDTTQLTTRASTAKEKAEALNTQLDAVKSCLEGLSGDSGKVPFKSCTASSTGPACSKLREVIAKVTTSKAKAVEAVTKLRELNTNIAARSTPTPSTPTTPVASVKKDLCEGIADGVRADVVTECGPRPATGATEIASHNTCKAGVEGRNRPPSQPSQVGSANRRIVSILEASRTTTSGNNDQLWSRIGERSSGSCNAAMNSARGGGEFAEMLRRFDQNTMGAGMNAVR